MTYDYELRLKPWRELTLLADFIDADGIHYNNAVLSSAQYHHIVKHPYYALDTGFMGVLVYFDSEGQQMTADLPTNGGCFDYYRTTKSAVCQSTFNKPTPNPGDSSEEHY